MCIEILYEDAYSFIVNWQQLIITEFLSRLKLSLNYEQQVHLFAPFLNVIHSNWKKCKNIL